MFLRNIGLSPNYLSQIHNGGHLWRKILNGNIQKSKFISGYIYCVYPPFAGSVFINKNINFRLIYVNKKNSMSWYYLTKCYSIKIKLKIFGFHIVPYFYGIFVFW
jgi:hypothetical protein